MFVQHAIFEKAKKSPHSYLDINLRRVTIKRFIAQLLEEYANIFMPRPYNRESERV